MRYRCDSSYERHDLIIVGGSPMRILRITPTALPLITDLESETELTPTPNQLALLARLESVGLIHPVPSVTKDLTLTYPSVPTLTPLYRDHREHRDPGETVAGALIIDDGSTPEIPGAHLRLDINRGPAAARNAGLTLIDPDCEYVIFLDSHVDPGPDPNWYLPLLALCQRDPQLAVVAPRVASRPGRGRRDSYETVHSPLDLGDQPGPVIPGTRIGYLPSTALLCRVVALREVGGFNEDLRCGEDVDLIWRLVAAGWTCRYHPEVVVHHPPRDSWRSWCTQRIGYGTSAAPLAVLHGSKVAPARIHTLSWIAWTLFLTTHPFLAIGTMIGSAVALARKVSGLPMGVAARITLRGTWRSGLGITTAVRRTWWPLLLPIAVISRRARVLLLLSLCAAGPPRVSTAITVLDDFCYSCGVWKGIIAGSQRRRFAALTPTRSAPGATVRS
jgi:mycofactocin system glycosyltransferase